MSSTLFDGATVAVTGGTGSFGHYIVKELLKMQVKQVIIVSRDEEKQVEMSREFPDARLKFSLGDVRDRERMNEILGKANIVYHAAALKIVPVCEGNPTETYKTNMLGSVNVHDACVDGGVDNAIFVSTDKAVKPVNTYGMTKALAERVWLEERSGTCNFKIVRYGNVIGSRGSVVPYFRRLISEGKPLPVTSKEMSRFLLTLQQSIELVFYATTYKKPGLIFVPKNPACKITDLVVAMAGSNYPTVDVGIRSGEKTTEVLISEEEIRRTEEEPDKYIIHPYHQYKSKMADEFTSANANQLAPQAIRELIDEAGLL